MTYHETGVLEDRRVVGIVHLLPLMEIGFGEFLAELAISLRVFSMTQPWLHFLVKTRLIRSVVSVKGPFYSLMVSFVRIVSKFK